MNILVKIRKLLGNQKRKFLQQFKFYYPNRIKIKNSNVIFKGNYPYCSQLLKITGEGKVIFGINCSCGYSLGGHYRYGIIEIQPRYKDAVIIFGNNISTNNNLFLCAANYIEIGDDTLIGEHVTIMDFEAHGIDANQRNQIGKVGKVIIGNNVWIGNNVTILKNTKIGSNTIIATGTVVSGKFPSDVIIGGVPARIIKTI